VLVSSWLSAPSAVAEEATTPAVEPAPSAAPPSTAAFAPSDAPAPAPPSPSVLPVPASSVVPSPTSGPWANDYQLARKLLSDGHFAEASARFAALASAAPSPSERALAMELGALAASWNARGAALIEKQELEDTGLTARRENRRTTDEIAVLYLNGVLYGIGTGAFVSVHTEPDSPAGVVLPALVLGGAGAGAVALVDSGHGLRYGVPQAIVSGMYLGLGEGITWSLWNQARVDYRDEWSEKTVANVIWAGATLGAVGGGVIGSVYGATPGRASYVESTALWSSLVLGLGVGSAISDEARIDDGALLASAIGLNAGALVGVFTAGQVAPSIARVRFLDLGALAGGLAVGGLYVSAAGRNPDVRSAMGLSALGVAAGLSTAWVLTSDMAKDHGPGRPATAMPIPSGLALRVVPGGATVGAYGFL
jgi:hypothetical protein